MESFIDKALPYVKKWWFSVLLIPFILPVLDAFGSSISSDIMIIMYYEYPAIVSPVMFVVDIVDLLLHEGGHTILGFFGWRFLTILGGSLFACLIPFLIFITAWRNKQIVVAQMGLFLTAYGWFSAAVYCADAQQLKLPLIGDLPKDGHDFMNMLTRLDIYIYSIEIAWMLYAMGVICCIGAVLWPLTDRPELERVQLDLKL